MPATQRGVSAFALISHRPAGATERAPKTLEIGNRKPARPGARMIVTVDAAAIGAAAELRCLHPRRARRAFLCPGAVAAKAAYRRPVWHRRRRRRLVERSKIAGAVDDPAADDRQLAGDIRDLGLRAAEVIAVRHDQIGELAHLDAAFLAFLVGEPGDVLGPHSQRGFAIKAVTLRR